MNIFGAFHTNICSLQASSQNLQNLINNLEYQFRVTAVSETWNAEVKKQNLQYDSLALLWGKSVNWSLLQTLRDNLNKIS